MVGLGRMGGFWGGARVLGIGRVIGLYKGADAREPITKPKVGEGGGGT